MFKEDGATKKALTGSLSRYVSNVILCSPIRRNVLVVIMNTFPVGKIAKKAVCRSVFLTTCTVF